MKTLKILLVSLFAMCVLPSSLSATQEYEPGFVQTVAEKYAKYGSGINVNVYAEFVAFAQNVSADQDENGNWVSGSRKAKVVAYIAEIPGLTPEQRNNLMLTDYSTYNLDDMPW